MNKLTTNSQKLPLGFTLIELMITIAIAAILITVGIPSFNGVIAGNRVEAHQLSLYSDLNLARSEAVGRGTLVGVCGRATATTCVATNNWSGGWLVFLDDGTGAGGVRGDGIRNGTEEIVRNYNYTGSNELIVTDTATVTPVFLFFNQRGFLSAFTGGAATINDLTMRICEQGDDITLARAVLVGRTGRVAKSFDLNTGTVATPVSDGVFEDSVGTNLGC